MATYRVADGTQVNIDGTIHEAGAVVEVDDGQAQAWMDAGVVEEVDAAADKPDKRYRRPK